MPANGTESAASASWAAVQSKTVSSIYLLIAETEALALTDGATDRELLSKASALARMTDEEQAITWVRDRLDAATGGVVNDETRTAIQQWIASIKLRGVQFIVGEEMASGYDAAQICTNGHVTNPVSVSRPEDNRPFCPRCGAKTTTTCERCRKPIRGAYEAPSVISEPDFSLPAFCENCGGAFPWTGTKLSAAKELADTLEDLSGDERTALKADLEDLVHNSARAPVAQGRFKTLMKKAGKEAADGMRSLIVDIVSETVKRSLWP